MEGLEIIYMDREKCLKIINSFRDIGNEMIYMKQE